MQNFEHSRRRSATYLSCEAVFVVVAAAVCAVVASYCVDDVRAAADAAAAVDATNCRSEWCSLAAAGAGLLRSASC